MLATVKDDSWPLKGGGRKIGRAALYSQRRRATTNCRRAASMPSDRLEPPRSILITGASSGIGEALALAYAAPDVTLALSGRDDRRLAAVDEACRARGAAVEADAVDVADRAAMERWLAAAEARAPLDLVVANAGISGGTAGGGEGAAQTRRIFEINVSGLLNTVLPAIPPMRQRGHGQLALMSSVASFRGMPTAPAYTASKAAVRAYGEALRGALAPAGIRVSVICPGFVRSRITAANRFPMPFLMDADRAARIIRRGLARDRARIAFPWPTYFGAWLMGALPPALTEPLVRRLPKK
jgi:short-subunit dehydrogenase